MSVSDDQHRSIAVTDVADGPTRQILSARGDVSLREAAIAPDGTAREWRTVAKSFDDYVAAQAAAAETWEREKGIRAQSHRFTPDYARTKTGEIYGGLRFVAENSPPSVPLRTVMLTLTGWPYDDDGRPAPPVEFLAGLRDGHSSGLRRLRRRLDDAEDVHQWGRVTVTEPHTGRRSGYPHCHVGVVVVGDVRRTTLREAVDAYVDANPFARKRDHGPQALTVQYADEDPVDAAESLAAELTNNLAGYEFQNTDGGPLSDIDDAVRRYAALMWVTGRQSHTKGTTFRKWVSLSQQEWEPDGDTESTASPPDTEDIDPPTYIEPTPTDVAYQFPDGGSS